MDREDRVPSHIRGVPTVTGGSDDAGQAVDTRQVVFIVVAILGLVVAALLVPPAGVDGPGSGPGSGPGTSDGAVEDGDGDGGDDGGGDGEPGEWLRWLAEVIDSPPDRPPENDEPRCLVSFEPPPEPGTTVTVTVILEGEPAADVPVRFEGERIGRTNDDGTVSGEVPYVRELTVRVGVESGPDCIVEKSAGARGSLRSPGRHYSDGGARTGDTSAALPVGVAAAQDDNVSVDVDVRGEMRVDVEGDAYPGTDVRVRARIGSRPVPDAEVSVDGDAVGTTDADGTATVTVPDDGRREVDVAVARGEYDATTVVDVLLLGVDLEPRSSLAVVPGADATVVATLGDRPAPGAVVSVAGRERRRTNETGHLDVVLPADPRATVRVETENQTATTSVADRYAVPAAAIVLLATLAVGVTARRRGRYSAATAAAAIGGLLAATVAVLVVDAHYGATARNAVIVAGCVLVGLVALGRRRAAIAVAATGGRRGLGRVAARLRALVATLRDVPLADLAARVRERLLAAALRTATLVSRAAERLRRSLARLRTVGWSVRGLLSAAAARLRRLAAAVSPRRAATFAAGVVALAAAVVAGYLVAGVRGAVAVAAVCAVLAVVARVRLRRATEDEPSSGDPAAAGTAGTRRRAPASRGRRSFREVWRAFARLVVPGRWRTSTPSEVARAAVDRGYPRRPVEELTTLFREVEYGDRSLSAAVRDRAATAFDSIRDAVGEGEDS